MTARAGRTEALLAALLARGTWAASAVIALGLALGLALPGAAGSRVTSLGIALMILLPVLRVAVMAVLYIRAHDRRFAAISALVLAIILLAALLGARAPGP